MTGRYRAAIVGTGAPTLSLAELDTLLAAERDSTARVVSVFQHRFGSGATRLRRLAGAGGLGRPLLATCHTLWYRDHAYFAVPWRGSFADEGGGPTMGHGIHQFYGYRDQDWTFTAAPGHEDLAAARAADGTDVPSGHAAHLVAVLDALDEGRPPPVTLDDARDTMEFVAAVYASAFTGEPVRCGQLDATNPFAARMDGTGAPWAGEGLP